MREARLVNVLVLVHWSETHLPWKQFISNSSCFCGNHIVPLVGWHHMFCFRVTCHLTQMLVHVASHWSRRSFGMDVVVANDWCCEWDFWLSLSQAILFVITRLLMTMCGVGIAQPGQMLNAKTRCTAPCMFQQQWASKQHLNDCFKLFRDSRCVCNAFSPANTDASSHCLDAHTLR